MKDDWRKADLSEAEMAMLEWVEKLTLAPSMMTEQDFQRLKDAGWSDRDILDIAHVCAYFNFRVRMVDGLGLELGRLAARAGGGRRGAGIGAGDRARRRHARRPVGREVGRGIIGRTRSSPIDGAYGK